MLAFPVPFPFSHSIKADSDYTLRGLLVSGVKRYRPNKIASDRFDFVRLPNPIENQLFD